MSKNDLSLTSFLAALNYQSACWPSETTFFECSLKESIALFPLKPMNDSQLKFPLPRQTLAFHTASFDSIVHAELCSGKEKKNKM